MLTDPRSLTQSILSHGCAVAFEHAPAPAPAPAPRPVYAPYPIHLCRAVVTPPGGDKAPVRGPLAMNPDDAILGLLLQELGAPTAEGEVFDYIKTPDDPRPRMLRPPFGSMTAFGLDEGD